MGIFDGMATAKTFAQPNYLKPGLYDLRIVRCLVLDTQRSGVGFIVELEVLSSTHSDHPVGSTASWFQGMSKNHATAEGAIKEFVCALMGIELKDETRIQNEINPNIIGWLEAAIGPQNIFRGRCIHVETFMKKTRERGLDFTVHRWTPYTGAPPPAMPAAAPTPVQAPVPVQQPMMQGRPPVPPNVPAALGYGQPQQAAPFQPPPGTFMPAPGTVPAPQPFMPPQGAPPPPLGGPPPMPPGMMMQQPPPAPTPIWDPALGKYRLP